jgi:hypothetical protein
MAKVTSNIGELNARTMTVTFWDNGAAALPSAVEWRLTCPDEIDNEVVAWTAATVSTGVGSDGYQTIYYSTIVIPATAHAMQTELSKERRLFIVAADRGTVTEFNEEWLYYVEIRGARS